jgi:uncharacterized coiled-coil protein SlyX
MARSNRSFHSEDEEANESLNVEDLAKKNQRYENEKAIDQAKKQVRFSLAELNEILPTEKNQADTEIRRRSSQRDSLPIPAQADTETEGHDYLDVHVGDQPIGDTPEEFLSKVDADFEKYRYTTTAAELNHDIEQKLERLATLYTRKNRITFPFRALTETGRTHVKWKGSLDFENWVQLVQENPDAMYQEMKIRAFQAIAYKDLAEQLHQFARTQDSNMRCLRVWATHFATYIQEGHAGTNQLTRELRSKEKEIDELSRIVADNARQMARQEDRIKQLSKKVAPPSPPSDDGSSSDSSDSDDEGDRRRQDTPASRRTDRSGQTLRSGTSGSTHKNIKIDVPIFRNENKDEMSFDFWYRMIENKLIVNEHHFDSDEVKRVYIESRVQGKAGENLLPYLSPDHPNRIKTSKALLKHLWTEYHDHNRRVNALSEYNDLTMEPGDDFTKFRNTFVRLAGECRKPRSDWKEEFHRKMLPSMMDKLAREAIDDNVDFEAYARVAGQLALNYEQTQKAKKKKDKSVQASTSSGNTGKSKKSYKDKGNPKSDNTSKATSTANTRPKLTDEEVKQLAREGRCFTCKEKGHIGAECPKRKADREARIAAIAAKYTSSASKDNDDSDTDDDGHQKN